MFFIISKLSYVLIAPENWLIALLLWRVFTRSVIIKKRLNAVIITLVVFFGNEVIFTKLVNAWQPKPVTLAQQANFEAGILLGGLSSFDKNNEGFLNTASDRLIEACILYKTGKIRKIIISGGSVYEDRPKEAGFLFTKLIQSGIPASDIIIEDRSRTTFENAAFTKRKIDSLQLKPPFVLVTSAMHIPRAERVFTRAGLNVIPFPCDYHVLDKKFDLSDYFVPKLYIIDSWNNFMKEIVGLAGYKFFNKA